MNPHTAASRSSSTSLARLGLAFYLALFSLVTSVAPLRAGDVTWNNGAATSAWNTTDANWSSGVWNNANGDGAIFSSNAGAINVNAPVSTNSLSFTANGFSLTGTGPLTFVSGSSTQGTGFINLNNNRSATINTPINSSLGLQTISANSVSGNSGGTLTLGGPITFSGTGVNLGAPIFFGDLVVGGSSLTGLSGGKVVIANGSVLPATTRVGISNGLLDIGSNNVTLSQLTFENQADNGIAWNNTTGAAAAGVIASGGGTLRVTGEINVLGQSSGASGNSIGANLDLGGGTQIIRVAQNTGGGTGASALQIAGVISNGSLLKSYGYLGGGSATSALASPDGMSLYGNNTYTGSTTLNGGANVITGTNATTSVKVAGPAASLTLQGANGSLLSATTIEAQTGAIFQIDNTAAVNTANEPNIPAAQNNNRIADNAEIQLLGGTFTYKGAAATAATETFGNLNSLDGANTVTITPGSGGGTVALTASGSLLMGSRSTLAITTPNVTPTPAPPATPVSTLGGTAQLFVTGSAPATDATGLVDRVYSGASASTPTDFVTYSPTTGFTPLAAGSYSSTFVAGTNVFTSGNATVATSVSVNAIKEAPLTAFGSATTTINAGQTLTVTSGMLLSALSGTRTYAGNTAGNTGGSTLDFGSAPGVSFGTNTLGTAALPIAITGSAGIINSVGTLTISAGDDLSGLTGELTNNGTTTLNTNTFGGTIHVLNGVFNLNASNLAPQGAITIGIPQNDANLIGTAPNLSLSGAGANSTIARDIIFNNGALTAAGAAVKTTFQPFVSVLSNTTANGTQTLSGNITLDSPGLFSGGSPNTTTALGSTSFTGSVSGPSTLQISGDRANFSGNISNAGVIIGATTGSANGTQVTFSGTTTGSVPISLESGNTGANAVGTQVLYNSGSLPTGPITVENLTLGAGVANIVPLQNSTINNSIILNAPIVGNVGSGISASWNGQVSGSNNLTKSGTGTLTLGNASNTYTGTTNVSAGTLLVNGANTSSSTMVANTGTLGGIGNLSGPVTVATGGTISPGNSIGTLSTGSLSLSGTYLAQINLNNGGPASADLLNVTGAVTLNAGSTLNLQLSNVSTSATGETFLIVNNDGADAVNGSFSGITGLQSGVTATINYAFNGTDSLGRVGDGNDIAVTVDTSAVPEPTTYAMAALAAVALLLNWRRHAARKNQGLQARV